MRQTRAIPVATLAVLLAMPTFAVRADDGANALSAEEKAGGFELLFDGASLEGWQQDGNWVIEDGAISRKDKGGALVWKVRPLPDDFELRFEWKVSERGNSGVYYRPGQYEYQILDNQKHSDGLNPRTSAASLYFCMAPSRDATRPVGEWNEARIVCQGTVIQHWLNGEKVVDFDYADPRWAANVALLAERGGDLKARGGFLSLQDHGDPVWYRSVKLRALTPDHDIGHATVEPAAIPEEALKREEVIVDRIRKNREAREKALKGQ